MSDERLDPALRAALRAVAHAPHLLVAVDYDGTLAPIVDDPSAALPLPGSIEALVSLAGLASTTVAVVSGRSLHDLAELVTLPPSVRRVGNHGSEFAGGPGLALDDAAQQLLTEVLDAVSTITSAVAGVLLEPKPAGVAVHVRRASRPDAARVLAAVLAGPARLAGVHALEGKEVVELSVIEADKGTALDVLRHESGATAVVFLGDDATDERAFAHLASTDVGVKVGAGETAAAFRVTDPDDVRLVIAYIGAERDRWLTASHAARAEPL